MRRTLSPSVIRFVIRFVIRSRLALPSPLLLTFGVTGCAVATDSPLVGGETCTALTSGTWTVTGAAFGMGDDNPMDGDVTMDDEACAFAFSDWSMQMDDLPSGGVVDGDAVQLDGLTSKWRTCTGTATDTASASGTCEEDGTAWIMVLALR